MGKFINNYYFRIIAFTIHLGCSVGSPWFPMRKRTIKMDIYELTREVSKRRSIFGLVTTTAIWLCGAWSANVNPYESELWNQQ